MAVNEVVKHVDHAKIHTDSSYACSSVAECFNASTLSDLCRCNHLDLHSDLLQHLKPSHQVVKIAARQNLTKLSGLDKYRALGNKLANDHAIFVCANYNLPWLQQLEQKHEAVNLDRKRLTELYSLHLKLGDARAKAEKTLTPEECNATGAYMVAQNEQQKLAQWTPSLPIMYTQLRDELREHFSWGADWTFIFETWLQTLAWDANGDKPLQEEVGVTWLELAMSFMMFTKRWIPCLRPDHNKETLVVFPANNDHAETLGYQATGITVCFLTRLRFL